MPNSRQGNDCGDTAATRPSLLLRLRDHRDSQSWTQFVEIYGPLLHRFLRSHGLQEADAADVTQEILQSVMSAIMKFDYDRQVGRFRGWLFTVAHSKLKNHLHKRSRQEIGLGDSEMNLTLQNPPSVDDCEQQWEQEYERRLFEWAADQIRREFAAKTWQAFWMVAVNGRDSQDVAQHLGLSVGAVYIAKSRVTARLKTLISQIDER